MKRWRSLEEEEEIPECFLHQCEKGTRKLTLTRNWICWPPNLGLSPQNYEKWMPVFEGPPAVVLATQAKTLSPLCTCSPHPHARPEVLPGFSRIPTTHTHLSKVYTGRGSLRSWLCPPSSSWAFQWKLGGKELAGGGQTPLAWIWGSCTITPTHTELAEILVARFSPAFLAATSFSSALLRVKWFVFFLPTEAPVTFPNSVHLVAFWPQHFNGLQKLLISWRICLFGFF